MPSTARNALEILTERGIVNTVSDPALGDLFARECVSFYCGYDPSFKSLQLGNLFAIATMRRLQDLGHRPVVLVGGATGSIGDPSGRSTERNLLDMSTVESNVAAIRKQLESLIDFSGAKNGAILVNNHDWLSKFTFLSFLREVGRRFRVGEMLAKESVCCICAHYNLQYWLSGLLTHPHVFALVYVSKSCVSIRLNISIMTLLTTTPLVLALPTSSAPPRTV